MSNCKRPIVDSRRRRATRAAKSIDSTMGCACVWFYIVEVNSSCVTVLDNGYEGGPNHIRRIPYSRISQLMSAGEIDAKANASELTETSDHTGIVMRGKPNEGTDF